jgi:hypothetical protein
LLSGCIPGGLAVGTHDVLENWKRYSAGEAVHGVGLRGN